jgi:hypothetical protein
VNHREWLNNRRNRCNSIRFSFEVQFPFVSDDFVPIGIAIGPCIMADVIALIGVLWKNYCDIHFFTRNYAQSVI